MRMQEILKLMGRGALIRLAVWDLHPPSERIMGELNPSPWANSTLYDYPSLILKENFYPMSIITLQKLWDGGLISILNKTVHNGVVKFVFHYNPLAEMKKIKLKPQKTYRVSGVAIS